MVNTEKVSAVALEKPTRHKGSKHKKFKNPAVVAKDTTEEENWRVMSLKDKGTTGVMHFVVLNGHDTKL